MQKLGRRKSSPGRSAASLLSLNAASLHAFLSRIAKRRGADAQAHAEGDPSTEPEDGPIAAAHNVYGNQANSVIEVELIELQKLIKENNQLVVQNVAHARLSRAGSRPFSSSELLCELCSACVGTGVVQVALASLIANDVNQVVAAAGVAVNTASEFLKDHVELDPTSLAYVSGVSFIMERRKSSVSPSAKGPLLPAAPCSASGAFPLMKDGKAVGVLTLFSTDRSAFSTWVVGLFEEMASDASLMLVAKALTAESRWREQQLEAIVETASMPLITAAPNLHVVICNEAACKLLGYTKEEVIGSSIARLLPDRSRDRSVSRLTAFLSASASRGNRSPSPKVTVCRADGEEVDVRVTLFSNNVAGKTMLTVVGRDDSKSRLIEQAKRSAERAEKASEAKTRFLGRMSHELRTPLNAVASFAYLLLEDSNSNFTEKQRRQIECISLAGKQLTGLLRDMFDVSQIEGGQLTVSLKRVSLNAVVEDTIALCNSQRETGAVMIAPLISDMRDHEIQTDCVRLQQILMNLMTNAVKYGIPGGVVEVQIFSDAEFVAVRVADNGIGMTKAQLSHLYEPYNRLGRESGNVPGTGIGLSISRELALLLGGSLELTSELNKGTLATLRLRKMPGRELLEGNDLSFPTLPLVPEESIVGTVLYVEDNAVNIFLVEQILARWPRLTLLIAKDGRTALQQAFSSSPDLILLDMQLPDTTGLELLHELRSDERTSSLPIYSVSADGSNTTSARHWPLGPTGIG